MGPEGLYNLAQCAEIALSLVTQPNALSEYELWHKRLSHISEDRLKLMSSGTATGINITFFSMDKYVACAEGKQHKVARGKEPGRRASSPFELMHKYLGGMVNIPSLGGAKFFQPCICDKSRFTILWFLKHKSGAAEKLSELIAMIETQFGVSIKAIRSDNGGEFIGKPFTDIMKVHGIVPELTARNSLHQNGVPEQKIRTLVTGAMYVC